MPAIDVVIPTRNRPEMLQRCLRSLTLQSFADFGVIVIDDESSPPLAGQIPADLHDRLRLRLLRNEPRGGPGVARNMGVQASDATYIAFIDDDVEADARLLERHHDALSQAGPRTFAFGRLGEPNDWDHPYPWDLWAVEKQEAQFAGPQENGWRQFFTANGFLRRESILEVGGFDERFTRSEDIELAYRIVRTGHEVAYHPDAIVWHYSARSPRAWLDNVRQYAWFDVVMDRVHPELPWLATQRREREGRRSLLRIAGATLSAPILPNVGPYALLRGSQAAFALRMHAVSMKMVSFAFHVHYERELAQALASSNLDQLLVGARHRV